MKNNDIIISLMLIVTSIMALFIPLSLFYIIAFMTIMAICFIIYFEFKNQVESKMSFWQLIILTIVFILAIVLGGEISRSFYYISLSLLVWFILYNAIVGYNIIHQKIDEKFSKSEKEMQSIWISVKNREPSGGVLCPEEVKRLIDAQISASTVEIYNNIDNQLDYMKNESQGNVDVDRLEKELKSYISSTVNSYAKQDREQLNAFLDNISNDKDDYKKFEEQMNKNLNDFKENYIISAQKSIDEIMKQVMELNTTNLEIIKNEKIRLKFEEAFKIAKNEIDIVSPWINNHVMYTTGVYDYIKNAINEGVKIKIVYGIGQNEKSSNDNSNSRKVSSEKIAQGLEKDFKIYGDAFKIKKGDTHSKILICDNKFAIIGSFNFLSFDGNYEKDVREELAVVTTDQATINKLRNQEFNF